MHSEMAFFMGIANCSKQKSNTHARNLVPGFKLL